MHLNRVGKIAHREWKRLQRRFPHIQLDVFTIMPDHIHGIIVISRRDTADRTAEMALPDGAVSLREQFGKPVHGSIPTIVRSYKSSTTRWINIVTGITGGTIWQRNYYEHIIRNDASLARIRQYIINNPIKWRTGTAGHAGRQIISVHTRRASKVKR